VDAAILGPLPALASRGEEAKARSKEFAEKVNILAQAEMLFGLRHSFGLPARGGQ
jgi:hypothetical protein